MNNQTHPSHLKYRPDIDGLRAIAVLAVVVFHAFPAWLRGGFIGVDIFFVISGFLISTIIFKSLGKGTFSFADFYIRRIRRIFPALIVVLVATLAFGWYILLSDELNQLGMHVAAGAGFVANLVLWGEAGYFDNSAETKPLLHLWSLGIEEQFYIFWPMLLWVAWKRKLNLLVVAIIITALSFLLNIAYVKQYPVATFYSPLSRIWELLCGSILAWLTLYKTSQNTAPGAKLNALSTWAPFKKAANPDGLTANFYSFAGLLLLVYGLLKINAELRFPGAWAMLPVAGSVLIIAAGPAAWFNRTVLSSKIFVWFGLISFPLYLWHWPILSFGRIYYNEMPPWGFRALAVIAAIVLAWLTVRLIERPFRFGKESVRLKISVLCGLAFLVGICGFTIGKSNLESSHNPADIQIKREGFEYAFEHSLNWYQGKGNWLFLGNNYANTVAKLTLDVLPSEEHIATTVASFSHVASAAEKFGTRVAVLVGPNKSTIYPEHLPDGLIPSDTRYVSFILDRLRKVPNLTLYDPTSNLLNLKGSEGLLYWRTDTHWNFKGAYLGYTGLLKQLGVPPVSVTFEQGQPFTGDLVGISKRWGFPVSADDNWDIVWETQPEWTEEKIRNEQKTEFGEAVIVTNENALSDKTVWVAGDSFTNLLKEYLNANFRKVHYLGHWEHKFAELPSELEQAEEKPDFIIIVRVERSF